MITYRLFKVWRRDMVVWKKNLLFYLLVNFVEPLIYLLAMGYGLGRFVGQLDGMTYVEFIAPAMLVFSVMNGTSFETTYGSYTRLKEQKTAQGIAMTPVSMGEVIGGEILWATTKALLTSSVIFLVLWIFDLMHSPMILLMPILMLVTGFLFASLGMLMTSLARTYDFFSYYYTLFISPMFVFSGTFFPLEPLPQWAQALAYCLPLTYAVRVARNLFSGVFGWDAVLIMVGLALLGVLVAWVATRRLVRQIIV
ncbi:MAG: ABC transporter permease [bacterium]|nr:ABC transporter permease [bacterium]